jgi:hypothetical protein
MFGTKVRSVSVRQPIQWLGRFVQQRRVADDFRWKPVASIRDRLVGDALFHTHIFAAVASSWLKLKIPPWPLAFLPARHWMKRKVRWHPALRVRFVGEASTTQQIRSDRLHPEDSYAKLLRPL